MVLQNNTTNEVGKVSPPRCQVHFFIIPQCRYNKIGIFLLYLVLGSEDRDLEKHSIFVSSSYYP